MELNENPAYAFLTNFIKNDFKLQDGQEKIIEKLIGDSKNTKLNIGFIGECGCGK